MAATTTVTTLDGTIISATIVAAHTWTADATGLFTTTADLATEWKAAFATMQAGHGDQLTPLQRLEANAETVLESTAEAKQSVTQQAIFRQDAQRELDAIYAAMLRNRATYGIDPNAQFNTYTYLKLEQTLQSDEALETLALQGHGLNKPPAPAYNGYTNDIQNKVDGKTLFVGGGLDNGQAAIPAFFDDVVMSHACFPVVYHNGVLVQLNQNGAIETPLDTTIASVNAMTYTRVLVAADFSLSATAMGPTVLVPNPIPAPPMPTPAAPLAGVNTFDGSITPETIIGLTPHSWTADATGLYTTLADLGAEWKGFYAAMQSGKAGNLTAIQRLEGNAEAVIENTNAIKLTASSLAAFRMDAQRAFDALDGAMRLNQATYGIDPSALFTAATYLKLEQTLQNNETLKELAYQGHGLNAPPSAKYDGYTTDFQNRVDGATLYVGGGLDNGRTAIAAFFDDVIISHASFPTVEINGVQTQLNQNGNAEDTLASVVAGQNNILFQQILVPGDFSTIASTIGPIVAVPAPTAPPTYAISPATAGPSNTYSFTITRSGDATQAATLAYAVAGSGSSPAPASLFTTPTGTISFAAGATSQTITVAANTAILPVDETFTTTLTGPAGSILSTPSATAIVPGNAFQTLDRTTNQATSNAGTVYAGPVTALQWQYLAITPDNISITATTPNAFIHTGAGEDAISVAGVGGTNVLDGGTGSNFLVGGTGTGSLDTFYVDDRNPDASIWSTVVNFHAGDQAVVFGLTPGNATMTWVDGQGAAGYTGLTLHAETPGKPTALLTLAGFTKADMASGRIVTAFGTETDGTPYLYVGGIR